MAKVIEIEDNGHVWHVPLQFIAEHRADHYADDPDTTREEEIEFVMSNSFEGIDWIQNNMNFSDYASACVKVKTPTVSEPNVSAEMNIIETP